MKENKVINLKEELNKKSLLEYDVKYDNRIVNRSLRIEEVKEDEQVRLYPILCLKRCLIMKKGLIFLEYK